MENWIANLQAYGDGSVWIDRGDYEKYLMNSTTNQIRPILIVLAICLILLIPFLAQCTIQQKKERPADEMLLAVGFRLLDSPQEIVPWRYYYVNRVFSAPSYRTPQGTPLPGWRFRVIATRRFFTDQSARIYYRIEDVQQSHLFSSTNQGGAAMIRIWPVGATLVLETFSGRGAFMSDATPVFVDCIHKFQPDASHFAVDTLFTGDWCYQRFSADGKARPMPAGASACHQCHGTALRLTGDLVFTVITKNPNSHSDYYLQGNLRGVDGRFSPRSSQDTSTILSPTHLPDPVFLAKDFLSHLGPQPY